MQLRLQDLTLGGHDVYKGEITKKYTALRLQCLFLHIKIILNRKGRVLCVLNDKLI